MANWLEKIVSPPKGPNSKNLPVHVRQGGRVPAQASSFGGSKNTLPNASIIYGMAASALFVIALCFLISGRWGTAILVALPAISFLGFALYFMRHPS